MSSTKKRRLSYRLDLLPVILPYHLRAKNDLKKGDLVYYGPSPEYYGIGEVVQLEEKVVQKIYRVYVLYHGCLVGLRVGSFCQVGLGLVQL